MSAVEARRRRLFTRRYVIAATAVPTRGVQRHFTSRRGQVATLMRIPGMGPHRDCDVLLLSSACRAQSDAEFHFFRTDPGADCLAHALVFVIVPSNGRLRSTPSSWRLRLQDAPAVRH